MLRLHYAENHTQLVAATVLHSHHYIWCAENLNIIIFSFDASTGRVFFEFQLNAYSTPLSLTSPHILYELQTQFDFMNFFKCFLMLPREFSDPKNTYLTLRKPMTKFLRYCFRSEFHGYPSRQDGRFDAGTSPGCCRMSSTWVEWFTLTESKKNQNVLSSTDYAFMDTYN